VQGSLNASERNAIIKNDDGFIGQEIEETKLWDEQLKQEREMAEPKYDILAMIGAPANSAIT
jgi:hypothetical protein